MKHFVQKRLQPTHSRTQISFCADGTWSITMPSEPTEEVFQRTFQALPCNINRAGITGIL